MSVHRGLHLVVGFLLSFGLFGAADAKADFFGYSSSVSVATVPTLASLPAGPLQSISIGSGNSLGWTTSSQSNINGSLPGGADINFGQVNFIAAANNTVVAYDVNFNYQVTITDSLGTSGTVNFTGELKGFARGNNPAINGSFLNYAVNPSSLMLDGNTFLVTLGVNTSPGSTTPGVLQGNIRLTAVPEPASMALVGLGGFCLHAVNRRRKRPLV